MAVPAIIARVAAGYSGYRRDRAKEDDALVREALSRELSKSREHLVSIVSHFQRPGNRVEELGTRAAKKAIDELEIFMQEAKLGVVGRSYKFPSRRKSAKVKDIRRLVAFDEAMVDAAVNISQTAQTLEDKVLAGDEVDLGMETERLRQYTTACRNRFKDRIDVIKKIGREAK